MVKITATYQGQLRCQATHGPSANKLHTDAPVDNKGRGETFSPTDLVATALITCMATIMGQQADTLEITIEGMTLEVDKVMSADRPRRIIGLPVRITMPIPHTDKVATMMKRAAQSCPVHHSIHPDIAIDLQFTWSCGRID